MAVDQEVMAAEVKKTDANTPGGFMQQLPFNLPTFNQLTTLFGLAAVMALAFGILQWTMQPSYQPIDITFSKGQIAQAIQVLENENIQHRLESGNLLLVASSDLDRAYLLLANAGIQPVDQKGMEVLNENQGYTTSKFIQSARYQRALEVELSRTISNMRNIDSARVHIAENRRSSLLKSVGDASASVMLSISAGRILESGQVLSIMELVAASVPYMQTANVKVVDQRGNLLSNDFDNSALVDNRQFEFKKKIENDYKQRIQDLLTPYVGLGQVKVEVNANVDFNQQESATEAFLPDQKVRSEKIQEQESTNANPLGVPGALTNQPPGEGTTAATNEANDENPITNTNRNEVRNYELDKTVTYSKKSLGEIQRLSVAVLMNTKTVSNTDAEGNVTETQETLTAQQLTDIEELVKRTIGFDEARGDSVVVYNIPFINTPIEAVATPIWQQAWVWDIAKKVFGGLLILFIFMKFIKPIFSRIPILAKPSEMVVLKDDDSDEKEIAKPEKNNTVEGSIEKRMPEIERRMEQLEYMTANNAELPPAHVYGDILNMAKELAKQDPKRVAKVVKDWVGQGDE